MSLNRTATGVFVGFFLLVTVLGFVAARWRRGDLNLLHEWGLGGRRFGTLVAWFLVGGDFYTAYTVIAVPALVYSAGAAGFFALPYTIIVYPIVFLVMPRLWEVCHENHFVTTADYVSARFDNRWLSLAVAVTGILATMPYIALQLVGIQVVIAALGFPNEELALAVAFAILAAYTYTSGLRAPAMIAFVKDTMIYIVVLVAVLIIPSQFGSYEHVFTVARESLAARGSSTGTILLPSQFFSYATLALGSALAAFMYPHTTTGVLSSSSARSIQRNAILLPAYTILLGLIALLGYAAIAAGVTVDKSTNVVPVLFTKLFPSWFLGFSFAAIAIGALVPAAIMSIGAANLWTRNIWRVYFQPGMTLTEEGNIAKIASLVVKFGALLFILFVPTQYAIDLQLLGGIWILQISPAIILGLFTRQVRGFPLLVGWVAGMISGTGIAVVNGIKPTCVLPLLPGAVYTGLVALLVNLIVCWSASAVARNLNLDGRSARRAGRISRKAQ